MGKIILAPYVRVGFLKGVLHFGFGSLRKLINEKPIQNALLDASVFLKTPKSWVEVGNFLEEKGHDREIVEKTNKILSHGFTIPHHVYDREDRHSRSLLYYALSGADLDKVQNQIADKHVAILGCGGIGNVIAVLLATAGVKKFTLIDNDHVEISNLSRQIMFTEADCGKSKTTCLATALVMRNSALKITEIDQFINDENLNHLNDCDFILVSGDEENVIESVNEFAIQKKIPYMNVGYIEDIAVWGPLVIPGKTGCYQCQNHLVNYENLTTDQINSCKEINKMYQAPSTGPVNMLAASLAALDILKFLGNFGQVHSQNCRIGLWTHDLHIEKQEYNLNPHCDVCGFLQKTKV